EVLAVPGHPFDARAAGCNMLIRDGATLVRHVADVIEVLEPLHPERGQDARQRRSDSPPRPEPDLHETDALHSRILSRLGPSPVAEDQLIRDLELAPASVTAVLVELELNGHVLRQSGGLISRVN
ncbi:MAG: DprA-like winged helix domain-containing protein, partial [Sulfitobacter sp.]